MVLYPVNLAIRGCEINVIKSELGGKIRVSCLLRLFANDKAVQSSTLYLSCVACTINCHAVDSQLSMNSRSWSKMSNPAERLNYVQDSSSDTETDKETGGRGRHRVYKNRMR